MADSNNYIRSLVARIKTAIDRWKMNRERIKIAKAMLESYDNNRRRIENGETPDGKGR